jgi:peptide/nickel transport system permease protein
VRRLLKVVSHLVLVLLAVSMLTMLLFELVPGDPVVNMIGPGATDAQVAQVRHELKLDRPLPSRYVHWVADAATGDLGRSVRTQVPVWKSVRERLPVTAEIALLSMLLTLLVSIPIGVLAAERPNGVFDRVTGFLASIFVASPPFFTAILLVFVLSVNAKVFPVAGWVRFTDDPFQNLRHLVLPVLAIALVEISSTSRLLRADMLETLDQDYIAAARARGLSTSRVLLRHALRPSSFTLVTVTGISLGRLIGGTLIVEQIFGLPGIGQLVVSAITFKDLIVVQGVVLVTATIYVLVNLVVQLLYTWLDPRVRGRAADVH